MAARAALTLVWRRMPGGRSGGEEPRRPWGGGHQEQPPAREPMLNISPGVLWLIVANLAVHLVRGILPDETDLHLVYDFALVSARLTGAMAWGPYDPLPLISYQFLHSGFDHLGINMVALLAFGTGVERRLGTFRFLMFYLVCGVFGGLAQVVAFPASPVPLIGASGAIAGCFAGAIRLVMGDGRAGSLANIRQVAVIAAVWLGSQVLFGVLVGDGGFGSADAVAWWSHIGGFLAGLLLIRLILPRWSL